MKQVKLPERGDIKKMIQRELHEQKREDIKIEVAFVVNFDGGDPIIANVIVDPYQPFPRWKCRQFVKDIVKQLEELEATKATGFVHQASQVQSQGTAESSIPVHTAGAAQVVL